MSCVFAGSEGRSLLPHLVVPVLFGDCRSSLALLSPGELPGVLLRVEGLEPPSLVGLEHVEHLRAGRHHHAAGTDGGAVTVGARHTRRGKHHAKVDGGAGVGVCADGGGGHGEGGPDPVVVAFGTLTHFVVFAFLFFSLWFLKFLLFSALPSQRRKERRRTYVLPKNSPSCKRLDWRVEGEDRRAENERKEILSSLSELYKR